MRSVRLDWFWRTSPPADSNPFSMRFNAGNRPWLLNHPRRPDGPKQIHLAANRRKRRARRLESLGVAADKEPEFAAIPPPDDCRRPAHRGSRRPWLEPDAPSSRIQSGVNVLDSTPIAPLFAPASAPSAPSQTEREASSSDTMAKIKSAPVAASRGVAATLAPLPASACGFGGRPVPD